MTFKLYLPCISLIVAWLTLCTLALGQPPRVPWTTSRVVGSPEPPPPYQLQRVYPKLTFTHPLDMEFAPGSGRRFVAQQEGKIYSFPDDQACAKPDLFFDALQVRDLKQIPKGNGGIEAVYGFTFHPKFKENHYVFICYVVGMAPGADRSKSLRISRFTVTGGANNADPPHCDMESEVMLLAYWGSGHCGGSLKFGRDGFLYISTGDGSDPMPPDIFDTGQNIGDLLASILRIDVDHVDADKPYAIPKDNPFIATPGARPEVWAYGLRNPWRMSFDRATGELWVADVGWETWESVYRIERGGNYGWSITEGPGSVHPDGRRGPTPIIPPTIYLSHAESCSITGGFVYRGNKLSGLAGQYIFGDWETRRVWAAPLVEKGLGKHRLIAQTDQRVVAFGEDHDGELYVVDYEGGGLFRIVPQPPQTATAAFPRKLSETGLFASVESHAPAPGVLPFSIRAQQWVDYSTSDRWIAMPGQEPVKIVEEKPTFPKDTVLTRTFSLETEAGKPATRRRIETQLLHFDGHRWNGYSYRWNDQQSDGALVDAAGDEATFRVRDPAIPGGVREQTWHFPSRAQCLACHTSWSGYAVGFNPLQLKHASGEQVASLVDSSFTALKEPLVDPRDQSADLNLRARSYLHANCAHCHRFGGGGSANIDLEFDAKPEKARAFGTVPTQGAFGIDDARVIAPGAPSHSVLYYRMAKLGSGHMPHMGAVEIDEAGLDLIARWIESIPPNEEQKALAAAPATEHSKLPPPQQMLGSTRGALTLLLAMDDNHFDPAARKQIISLGYASEREEIRGLFARFIPADQRIKTLGTSFKSQDVLTLTGDAARGRKIFAEFNGGLCQRCHRVTDSGDSFGPDLTHIASKYDRVQLLENIVAPSKTIAQGFTTYRIKLKTGDPQTGLIVSRTDAQIVLKTGPGVELRIPTADVESIKTDPLSLMPEGLLSGLTPQQAADLLEYLQSLK